MSLKKLPPWPPSDLEEMAAKNLHVFRVFIDEYGEEEVAFQGYTRERARVKFQDWLKNEPHAKETFGPERTGRESAPP